MSDKCTKSNCLKCRLIDALNLLKQHNKFINSIDVDKLLSEVERISSNLSGDIDVDTLIATFIYSTFPVNVSLGESEVFDNFFFSDGSIRPLTLPTAGSELVNNILNDTENKSINVTQDDTRILVGPDFGFVNALNVWDSFAEKRFAKSCLTNSLPTKISYRNVHVGSVGAIGSFPTPDQDDTNLPNPNFTLSCDGIGTGVTISVFDNTPNNPDLPIGEFLLSGGIFDQGLVGSCYANAMSIIIVMNRALSKIETLTVIQSVADLNKYTYFFKTDSDKTYANHKNSFATSSGDAAEKAANAGLLHIIRHEATERPSRAFIQYISKRRRQEDANISVLNQGSTLAFTIDALRIIGVPPEKTYLYPELFNIDPTVTDPTSKQSEEFIQKYSYPPDGYLSNRAIKRGDLRTLQGIPLYTYNVDPDAMGVLAIYDDLSSYVDLTGTSYPSYMSDDQKRYFHLIRNHLNNKIPLFHIMELTNATISTIGVVESFSSVDSGLPLENRSFHTAVIAGYDDTREQFEIQSSWGTGGVTDAGFIWVKYQDFFNITVSVWAIVNNGATGTNITVDPCEGEGWNHLNSKFEFYRFQEDTIFNISASLDLEDRGQQTSFAHNSGFFTR